MHGLARAMAWAGGAVLLATILTTCASILGRVLADLAHHDLTARLAPAMGAWLRDVGVGPITGAVELVEMGMAFAVFAFLPLCQITDGHAAVDLVTARLPARVALWLRALAETAFAGVLILIAVQLARGTRDRAVSGQTTFLLELPLWWAYAAGLGAAAVAALVAVHVAAGRLTAALGRAPGGAP